MVFGRIFRSRKSAKDSSRRGSVCAAMGDRTGYRAASECNGEERVDAVDRIVSRRAVRSRVCGRSELVPRRGSDASLTETESDGEDESSSDYSEYQKRMYSTVEITRR